MLDSHVLSWWLSDNPTLCEHARGLIADTDNYVAASAVSVWEFRIKSARGKLSAPDTLEEATRRSGFAVLNRPGFPGDSIGWEIMDSWED